MSYVDPDKHDLPCGCGRKWLQVGGYAGHAALWGVSVADLRRWFHGAPPKHDIWEGGQRVVVGQCQQARVPA